MKFKQIRIKKVLARDKIKTKNRIDVKSLINKRKKWQQEYAELELSILELKSENAEEYLKSSSREEQTG